MADIRDVLYKTMFHDGRGVIKGEEGKMETYFERELWTLEQLQSKIEDTMTGIHTEM